VDLSDMTWQAECVLITRPDATIRLHHLNAGAAAFAAALLQSQTIANAATAALAVSPGLDIGGQLGALIGWGALMEIVTI
jgi:hypothetical protein